MTPELEDLRSDAEDFCRAHSKSRDSTMEMRIARMYLDALEIFARLEPKPEENQK